MKWHTIKSEKWNVRRYGKGGEYATFPIYEHASGKKIGHINAWTRDISAILRDADKAGTLEPFGFYKLDE